MCYVAAADDDNVTNCCTINARENTVSAAAAGQSNRPSFPFSFFFFFFHSLHSLYLPIEHTLSTVDLFDSSI